MKINEVTLLGNKDHGKSTLIGNLLITTKSVSKQRINDARKASKKLGVNFEPGFILDSFEEERKGRLTMDTTRAQVLYKGNAFEFIDVPGHEELIKNMISGAANADFAVLVVSAKAGEGLTDQAFRHLYLAGMIGIKKITVAVNKMDKIGYSESKFEEISAKTEKYLLKIGFMSKDICFVPISAYDAENLASKSSKMRWYKGKPLLDLMVDQSKSASKMQSTALRISVQGVLKDENLIIGRMLSGKLKKGQDIILLPENSKYKVSKIFTRGKKTKTATAGQNIAIGINKQVPARVRGSVICAASYPLKSGKKFNAIVFAVKPLGRKPTIKFNGNAFSCKVKIRDVIDTATGSKITGALKSLDAANVAIETSSAITTEPFRNCEELGRFVLYNKNEFAGIGVII